MRKATGPADLPEVTCPLSKGGWPLAGWPLGGLALGEGGWPFWGGGGRPSLCSIQYLGICGFEELDDVALEGEFWALFPRACVHLLFLRWFSRC